MNIDQILDNIYYLPVSSKELFKSSVSEVNYAKGHILLKADKVENYIYFIKKGIVRAYSQKEDNEITFWFGKEGDTVVSMKSYVLNEKGYENIELLENSTLYQIDISLLQQYFNEDIFIANWGRKFAEQEIIKTEERQISFQFQTALQRYQSLIKEKPDLLQRVQLSHIASYLGITQVSLSRIRAEIR